MSRELRWLARELRPRPVHERSVLAGVVGWVFFNLPELLVTAALVWIWRAASSRAGSLATLLLFLTVAALVAWRPGGRRRVAGLFGCSVTRHRMRTALVELRLTSRAGRLPRTLWLMPTPVGERMWLWCRAGMSAEDLSDEVDHLRAACIARDVRVTRGRRWAALVVVDVIRRDPLASRAAVRSPLADEIEDADA